MSDLYLLKDDAEDYIDGVTLSLRGVIGYAIEHGMLVPVEPDYEAATARTRHIFKPDVDWAQHPDPMNDEDWQRLARSIVNAALGASDE